MEPITVPTGVIRKERIRTTSALVINLGAIFVANATGLTEWGIEDERDEGSRQESGQL